MDTRGVTSAVAYVPEQAEAGGAAATAGARATKARGGGVAKAAIARPANGASATKAATASRSARPKAKPAAAPRTKVVPSGPGQVTVPAKGYATTTASKSGKATTTSSKKTTASSTKPTGDYAFMQDASLSAQEKLILFLATQKKNASKELETMLDKATAQKEAAAKKSGGGLFGGATRLFDVAKAVVPALGLTDKLLGGKLDDLLKQVSGPMLGAAATALGMPALAPLAMSMGPKLVGAVMDAQLPGTEKTSATSTTSTSAKKGGELDEVELARVQMLQKRVEEWTALISNLLQSFHQARMNVLQNLR